MVIGRGDQVLFVPLIRYPKKREYTSEAERRFGTFALCSRKDYMDRK